MRLTKRCGRRGTGWGAGAADRAAFRVGRQHGEGDRPSIPGTVVSDLVAREPLWMGSGRKAETLDGYFRVELSRYGEAGLKQRAWTYGRRVRRAY